MCDHLKKKITYWNENIEKWENWSKENVELAKKNIDVWSFALSVCYNDTYECVRKEMRISFSQKWVTTTQCHFILEASDVHNSRRPKSKILFKYIFCVYLKKNWNSNLKSTSIVYEGIFCIDSVSPLPWYF